MKKKKILSLVCQSCIKFGAIKVLKSENIKSYYISANNVWNLKLFPIRSQVQSLVAGLGFNRRGKNQKFENNRENGSYCQWLYIHEKYSP